MSLIFKFTFMFVQIFVVSSQNCFIKSKNNTNWKLTWEDQFSSSTLNDTKWNIDRWCNSTHCNEPNNVQLLDGLLVLSSSKIEGKKSVETGAMISTKQYFGVGRRIEIRAALPLINSAKSMDRYQVCLLVDNANQNQGSKDKIMIICNYGHKKLERRVATQKHITNRIKSFDTLNPFSFHLFGIEWQTGKLHFIFDKHFSKEVPLNEPIDPVQIKLLIKPNDEEGVDDDESDDEQISPKADNQTECTALIVDYVRVYEKIDVQIDQNLSECWDSTLDLDIKMICKKAFANFNDKTITFGNDSKGWNQWIWIPVILTPFIVIFILLIVCHFVKIRKMQQQIQKPQSESNEEGGIPLRDLFPRDSQAIPDGDENDDDHNYEGVYEAPIYDDNDQEEEQTKVVDKPDEAESTPAPPLSRRDQNTFLQSLIRKQKQKEKDKQEKLLNQDELNVPNNLERIEIEPKKSFLH